MHLLSNLLNLFKGRFAGVAIWAFPSSIVDRFNDILAFDINGFNLIRRSGHDLFGRQDFCLDQVADDVVCHVEFGGRLRHRQPFVALFGRKVCVSNCFGS